MKSGKEEEREEGLHGRVTAYFDFHGLLLKMNFQEVN